MHCDLEALPDLAQQILLGDAAVREDQLICRRAPDTHLLLLGAEAKARRSLLYDEGGNLLDLASLLLDHAGDGEDNVDICLLAVGDEDLGSVYHIFISVQNSLGLLALSVCSCTGLGKAEGSQLLALRKGNQIFCLLLLRSEGHDGITAQGCMCGNDNARGAADLGKLLHAHHISQGIAALSAVLLGNGDAQKTVLRHLAGSLSGELFRLVNLLCQRLYFFFGKLLEKSTRHFMFFAQRKIHDLHSSIYLS